MRDDERDAPTWHHVTVTVAADEAERAADVLWVHGVAGVEERPGGTGTVTLVGGFADLVAAQSAVHALGAAGWETVRLAPVHDDGLDAWRDHASAVDAPPFLVVPAWLPLPDGGDRTVLHVDPGRTFGSGSHPTTRLVLGATAATVVAGSQVLDVGCGSGILSVAAAVLGAASVVAIDIDPAAAIATDDNARRAGVQHCIEASDAPLAAIVAHHAAGFDVVMANLLAPVILELGPDLVRALAPGGALIASGLLADRWEAVLPAVAPLRPVEVLEDEGWVAVVLRAPGR